VALLSQREDITEEEEPDCRSIESYRNSIVEQLQKVQQSITSAIDGILTTSQLPQLAGASELNPEGIKQDFQKLFDDPKLDLRWSP